MNVFQRLLLLALAGAIGTWARYAISTLASRYIGSGFPWGTLCVNLVGCFLFGWIWTLASERKIIGDEVRLILLTGFLGALTTFSSYAFETADHLRKGDWGIAALNMFVENGLGLAAVFAGIAIGRWK